MENENVPDNLTQGQGQDQGSGDKAPGWYPDRASPNVQKYWDGSAWIAQRRWINAQWVNEPPPGAVGVPGVAGVAGAGTALDHAAQPYSYASASRPSAGSSPATTLSVTPAVIGLFVSSVLLIVGSLTPWITVSISALSTSASGTNSGISDLIGTNGWVTFAGGLMLLVLVFVKMINPQPLFQTLTLVIAVVVAGFAVFDLVRIIQKISQAPSFAPSFSGTPLQGLQPDINVGWGLIVLLIAALGAVACAIAEARS